MLALKIDDLCALHVLGVFIPHHALGLQTERMVIVLGPMVEAAGSHMCLVVALGYGLGNL